MQKNIYGHNSNDGQGEEADPPFISLQKSLCPFLQFVIAGVDEPTGKQIQVYSDSQEQNFEEETDIFNHKQELITLAKETPGY